MRLKIVALLALTALPLAGCVGPLGPDPFQRPNNWSLNGAPLENTAIEVDQKSDLLNGRSDPASNGVAASAAIDQALGGPAGTAAGLQKAPASISFTSGS
jgi:hypothetical protein